MTRHFAFGITDLSRANVLTIFLELKTYLYLKKC